MTVELNGIAAVGEVLVGKYRVDKILGVGGMGMVVAATHLELDQRVALKFMLPSTHDAAETSARFLREARAAGRLNSDHVCRVIDVGRFDGGTPYIVMEYLQGEDLGALLRRRGPLRVSEAVGYILQAIEGIAEAHANGIIHRDLKPDNLFVHKRNDGGTIVKVLDFGISKAKAAGLSTRTGDVFGSPAYMAPEQMESSRSVDHRADVWSLGVVLYQLVVGKPPFQGDSLPLLCMSVVNDEPMSMSEIRGDLPGGFEAAVMRCLRKEPEERYADVGELAHALAPFGPRDATTSASRIQIVLRRTRSDSSSLIPTEPATEHAERTGSSELGAATHLDSARDASLERDTSVLRRAPGSAASAAPAPLGDARRRSRRSQGLVAMLVATIVAVSVAIVMVKRRGEEPAPEPPTVAVPSRSVSATGSPSTAAPPAAPAPIVEPLPPPASPPIVEPIDDPAPAPAPAQPAASPTADRPPVASPRPEVKKRKPRRPASAASAHGRTAGSAGDARAGSKAGSASEPDDDKWMHMTHDDKKP